MKNLGIQLLAIAVAVTGAVGQTTDELGDDSNVYNGFTGAGRGNIIDVTTTVELIEIRQSVNLRSTGDLHFVVKRFSGGWAIELDHIVPAQGPGHPAYWSSGAISHLLMAGERYAIMMYWSVTGDYYNDNSSPVFGAISFGTHFDNAYQNSYPPTAATSSVSHSWIPHQWYITQSPCPTPADLQVRTVDAADDPVLQGATASPVTVSVENVGGNLADTVAVTLSFMGSVDRTAEYSVVPDPLNPTSIGAGATEVFAFAVDVSPTASLELITIDGNVTGNDTVCSAPVADAGADTPDTWTVVDCLTTICGDCNGDMMVTILDALTAAQHSAAITLLFGVDFTNCNVVGALEPDPAADVSILDALTLAQTAAGLPVTLSCC